MQDCNGQGFNDINPDGTRNGITEGVTLYDPSCFSPLKTYRNGYVLLMLTENRVVESQMVMSGGGFAQVGGLLLTFPVISLDVAVSRYKQFLFGRCSVILC